MSRSGDVTLELGGEDRTFRLAIGQWRKIQEKCDAGPAELLARLAPVFEARRRGLSFSQIVTHGLLGAWRVDDVREVVLQGLLGAGVDMPTAAKLVREWVDERPLFEPLDVAYRIVLASIVGVEDEQAMGELRAAEEASRTSPAASDASAKTATTRSAEPSAGTPGPSTP
jgi:hypothetical protein